MKDAEFRARSAESHSQRVIRYFERLIEAAHAMSAKQEAEFHAWHSLPTSRCIYDWPGWVGIIGVFPGRPQPTVVFSGKRASA
jgi:hypothetical protein